MELQELEQMILAFIQRPTYQPVKPKVIAKKLELNEEDTQQLRRVIKKLARQGQINYGDRHLVRPAVKVVDQGHIGVFRRTEQGSGFVRLPPKNDDTLPVEVYVSPDDARDASTGDRVQVKILTRATPHHRASGRIVAIVERRSSKFVGVYYEEHGQGFVRVDGTRIKEPIWVGDPGAKNARPGDQVVFEMVRFPSSEHHGEGVLTEVLGARGEAGVDTLTVIREFGFPDVFPEDALEEARQSAQHFQDLVPESRTDFTQRTIVTIDPRDARDFDDAVEVWKLENGHWMLGVHIADVSHFVPLKSALDREARLRGTSVYLPDRVLPMLPEVLSNGVASLQPLKLRFVLSARIEFTPEGTPVHTDFYRAAICSQRRFTYEEIDEYLADSEAWRAKLTPEVFNVVANMRDLARILRGRRRSRGALELSLSEVKIDLNADGRVGGAHLNEQTESHEIIEEFMLAANEAVAERLHREGLFFLRRVHQPPSDSKITALNNFVRDLGYPIVDLRNRFELQQLLIDVTHRPENRAINYAVLRSLQRARYSPEEIGHFALASHCYCHFTSPIRRYPDLTVHRLLTDLLTGQRPTDQDFETWQLLGESCSQTERRAEEAERELTKLKLLDYLKDKIGLELDAIVTGVEEFGLFVQGVELPAEGLISLRWLADDHYLYDRGTHTLSGHRQGNVYRLGDAVKVSVARVDLNRRELDFKLLAHHARKITEPLGTAPRETALSPKRKFSQRKPSGPPGRRGKRRR